MSLSARPLRWLRCSPQPAARPSAVQQLWLSAGTGSLTPHHNTTRLTASCLSQQPHRCFGIMDRIQNRLQERQQKQSDEFFVQLLNEMARMPRFTLQEYRKTQQDIIEAMGATGWKAKLPGMSGLLDQVEPIKKTVSIIDKFTPVQQQDIKLIDADTRLRVATENGMTVTDINWMLQQYKNQKVLQQWVASRLQRGLKLPSSQEEMHWLMIEDRPKIPQEMRPKPPRIAGRSMQQRRR